MTKRKKSYLWEFFRPINSNKACCNLCKNDISYKTSTTNLKKHIERRHPVLLQHGNIECSDPLACATDVDAETVRDNKEESSFEEIEPNEANIFIEYCVDDEEYFIEHNSSKEKTDSPPKGKEVQSSISKTTPQSQDTKKQRKNDLNLKCGNPRYELLKIQIEAAKKDLELRELQLVYAKREDERKRREHELTMKIKEAQLQAILRVNDLKRVLSV